ncbi:MAG: hypothetical protein ACYDIA_12600 [Candidatus Humimicrobiaceae bacterium]
MRYPALQLIAGIYRILAWLVVVLGVIGVIFGFVNLRDKATIGLGVSLILGSLIGGAISCVTLYAASEATEVFIDIEENTRLAVSRMNRKSKK